MGTCTMEENRRSSRARKQRNYAEMNEVGVPSQSPHDMELDSRPPSRRDRSDRHTPSTKRTCTQNRQQRRQDQHEEHIEDEEEQHEEQIEDEEEQREEQAEERLGQDELYRIYGIPLDHNNIPLMQRELFQKFVKHVKSRAEECDTSFWDDVLRNPLPSKEDYFNSSRIQYQFLFPPAPFGEPYVLNEEQENESREAAMKQYRLDYAIRRFDIDTMTIDSRKCGCCNKNGLKCGSYMTASGKQSDFHDFSDHGNTRHVYDNGEKFIFLRRSETHRDDGITLDKDGNILLPVPDVCSKCFSELDNNLQPTFGKYSGFDDVLEQPNELKGLTFAEEALIQMIQPCMAATSLKTGARLQKGHVVFVDRSTHVKKVCKDLPRLISDLDIVQVRQELRKPGGRGDVSKFRLLHVRRQKVLDALQWLKRYAPAYRDITINMNNLNLLPETGYLAPPLLEEEAGGQDPLLGVDSGPAPLQTNIGPRPPNANNEIDGVEHHGTSDLNQEASDQLVNRIQAGLQAERNRFLQGAGGAPAAPPPVYQEIYNDLPYVPWDTPHFFAMSYPTLFLPKLCTKSDGTIIYDYPAEFKRAMPRQNSVIFCQWVTWLMKSNPRYSAHPTFKFSALNIKHKEQTISQTKFRVKQMPEEEPMTVGDLQEVLQQDRQKVVGYGKTLLASTKSIQGSSAYWTTRRKDLQAMIKHLAFEDGQYPVVFMTGSAAEFHWRDLHRCLHKYLLSNNLLDDEAHIRNLANGNASDQESRIFEILQERVNVVNAFFVARTNSFFKIVIEEGLEIEHHWRRYEFAKSRGTIHFHALLFKKNACTLIQEAFKRVHNAASLDQLIPIEREIVKEVINAVEKGLISSTAEHPSGRKRKRSDPSDHEPEPEQENQPPPHTDWSKKRFTVALHKEMEVAGENLNEQRYENVRPLISTMISGDTDVHVDDIGNIDQWPEPEGLMPKPDSTCLRTKVSQIPLNSPTKILKDSVDFANRVCLHCCSSYCLRSKMVFEERKVACRFGYGEENPNVGPRSNGMKCRHFPEFEIRNGMCQLAYPRDHPRYIQGPFKLCRCYGGNFDFQPIIAPTEKDSKLFPAINGHETLQQWMEDWENRVFPDESQQVIEKSLKDLRDLHKTRNYFSDSHFLDVLCDYVCSYATKGEMSSKEGAQMFVKLISSNTIQTSMEFKRVATKFNLAVLGCKAIATAEAVFLLQDLHLYSSSIAFQDCNLKSSIREISEIDNDNPNFSVVKENFLDKFFKSQQDLLEKGSQLVHKTSLHSYCKKTMKVTNFVGEVRPSYPFGEEFCQSQLLIFKNGITRIAELKSDGETFLQSFQQTFLNVPANNLQPGQLRMLQRAFVDHKLGKRTTQGASHNREIDEGDPVETPPDNNEHNEPDDINWEILERDNLEELSLNPHGTDPLRSARERYPTQQEIEDIHASFNNSGDVGIPFHISKVQIKNPDTGVMEMKYPDPSMARDNDGQTKLLLYFFQYIQKLYNHQHNEGEPPPQPLRGIVSGQAGTGKSFVISIMRLVSKFVLSPSIKHDNIAMNTPTGRSAAEVDGTTFDKDYGINRQRSEEVEMDSNILLSLIAQFQHYIGYFGDEISMIGKKFFGNIASTVTKVMCIKSGGSTDATTQGNISISMLFGDCMQLTPVKDTSLWNDKKATTIMGTLGEKVYETYTSHFLLDKPMRQDPHCEFITRLQGIRDGSIKENVDDAVQYWNNLKLANINLRLDGSDDLSPDAWNIMNPEVIVATCYNKDRDDVNWEYCKRLKNVCIVNAICQGSFANKDTHPKMGLMNAIPRRSAYAINMAVKLTVNLAPQFHLVNSSRGTIRDIVYEDFKYDSSKMPKYLLVEFPEYTGPAFFDDEDRKTWVPIIPIERRSECKKCSRTGFPIVLGKADSVHSLQGLTVGSNKPIKRLIFKGWCKNAESKWPGIFYVAASRAKTDKNIALDFEVTNQDFSSIATTPTWMEQHKEAERLKTSALEQREGINPGPLTDDVLLKNLTKWICEITRERLDNQNVVGEPRDIIENCITQWENNVQI